MSHMECNEVKKLIAGYVDHSLAEEMVQEIEEHLCVCEACRTHLSKLLEKKTQGQEKNAKAIPGTAGKKAIEESFTFAAEEAADRIEESPALLGEEDSSIQDVEAEEEEEQPKPKKVSSPAEKHISQYIIMAVGIIIGLILIAMFLNYQQIR